MTRILTIGTFDLLHPGHLELLQACRNISIDAEVVVGLNTDEFVKEFKGKAPVMSYEERARMLNGVKYVDDVLPNTGGSNASELIDKVFTKPGAKNVWTGGMLAIGSDWHGDKYLTQLNITWDYLHKRNIVLVYIPRKDPQVISTSIIKDRLNDSR